MPEEFKQKDDDADISPSGSVDPEGITVNKVAHMQTPGRITEVAMTDATGARLVETEVKKEEIAEEKL